MVFGLDLTVFNQAPFRLCGYVFNGRSNAYKWFYYM
jgi:hypothetical protein